MRKYKKANQLYDYLTEQGKRVVNYIRTLGKLEFLTCQFSDDVDGDLYYCFRYEHGEPVLCYSIKQLECSLINYMRDLDEKYHNVVIL